LSELLKKQAAESKRNGVVGSSGTTIPINPRIKEKEPARISRNYSLPSCTWEGGIEYLFMNNTG